MNSENKFLHNLLSYAIFIKGLSGLLEFAGSMVLFFIASRPVTFTMNILFSFVLAHDPDDPIANLVIKLLGEMSKSTRLFGATVLLIFGLINLFLVIAIWKEKFWIYPSAAIVIMFLIVYQIFRFSHTGSIALFLLTLLDILIVFLLFREYSIHMRKRF